MLVFFFGGFGFYRQVLVTIDMVLVCFLGFVRLLVFGFSNFGFKSFFWFSLACEIETETALRRSLSPR